MNLSNVPRGFTTRFAPAPTGHLHLGHLVNAVWVWGLARAFEGRVLLRIEDHDRGRSKSEYEESILEDLRWLGFAHDGEMMRQSDHRARYESRLLELESRGLAYACICSRADIGKGGRHSASCRTKLLDPTGTVARRVVMDGHAIERFDDLRHGTQEQEPVDQCGDMLARDRNDNFTYQFAVVVDDIEQGVDLVIRGDDLLDSTGRQIRLARLLDRATPPRFAHHPLVMHPDGRKLSKSAGDAGVRELRALGATAESVLGRAAQLGGLPHDGSPIAASELHRLFR